MTCEARLTMADGFPYTCGLPAQLCTLVGEIGKLENIRLCADCRQDFRNDGYAVILNPTVKPARDEFNQIAIH